MSLHIPLSVYLEMYTSCDRFLTAARNLWESLRMVIGIVVMRRDGRLPLVVSPICLG